MPVKKVDPAKSEFVPNYSLQEIIEKTATVVKQPVIMPGQMNQSSRFQPVEVKPQSALPGDSPYQKSFDRLPDGLRRESMIGLFSDRLTTRRKSKEASGKTEQSRYSGTTKQI